ncbi:hypothetical protein DL95DRAFT_394702 [Leptodontidium sp. 2 PMI_412]|nr:hypothetical protein DL95DRAFT_394702 [Leptodontidium sp. 2 PMI_412]
MIDKLSFDTTGSYLFTHTGTVAVDSPSASNIISKRIERQTPQYLGVGLSLNGEWITYNSENLVWLPPEYRPCRSIVSGSMIGIGVGSGRVWMCNLEITSLEQC